MFRAQGTNGHHTRAESGNGIDVIYSCTRALDSLRRIFALKKGNLAKNLQKEEG